MSMRQLIVILVTTLSLTACGFHLRGQLPISEAADVIYVEADESVFKQDLLKQLSLNGAEVVADASAAKVSLQVNDIRVERETSTIDDRGKVNSFSVYYTVVYAVIDREQQVLQQNSLQEKRDYTFDPLQVLQQEREEEELIEDMQKELIVRLVRQLSVL